MAGAEELDARTRDACHIDAVERAEVELPQRLAVDLGTRHYDAARDDGLVFGLPVYLYLFADERLDGCGVLLGADDVEFVALLEHRLAVGHDELRAAEDGGAHHVAAQEVAHRLHRLAHEGVIGDDERHGVGLGVGVVAVLQLVHLVLLLGVDAADVTDGDGSADDAEHTERVGAGVAVGYLGSAAGRLRECFIGSAEARGVGDCAAEHTHHHGQVDRILGVEE